MRVSGDRSTFKISQLVQGDCTPRPVLVLFCIYILAWFWQLGIRREWLGAIRFEFLLGALLAILAMLLLASQGRSRIADEWPYGLLIAVGILFSLITIQVPLSIVPEYSSGVFLERVVKFAFISIFIIAFIRCPENLRWLVVTLLIAWGYLTFESFRSALKGTMIWESQGVPRLRGDTPMFRHPNSLAGMAIGVLPFAFFVLPLIKKNWLRVALLFSVVTALGCVMYSGSRTAYLGVAALCFYLVFAVNRSIFKAIGISVIILTISFIAMPEIYQARLLTIVTGEEIEGASMDARKTIQEHAIAVFKANPLGVGVQAFPEARERMFGKRPDTHNLYLEVATNLGIQGLISFVFFIILLLKTLWGTVLRVERSIVYLQTLQKDAERDPVFLQKILHVINDYLWIRAISLAVTGYILLRLVLGLFGHDLYEVYWWLSFGFAVVLFRIAKRLDAKIVGFKFT